ncbi:MAG: hypothetical protein AB7F41_00620 [Methylocystis sp.]|uniref:hypothetical protein n=1 Tax=Methylocystis sp. TaxID=1911079 RepID=UPI003D0EF320
MDAQGTVGALQTYFGTLVEDAKKLPRQRVAVLVEIAANRDGLLPVLTRQLIANIEGRLRQVQAALQTKHIFLLGGGALEHYLPSYEGHRYALNEGGKKKAVAGEIALLATGEFDDRLAERYGELFKCIEALPAKPPVDTESVLRGYVSNYIHELQGLVVSHPHWRSEQIVAHFEASQTGLGKLITLEEFERPREGEFRAVLKIAGPQGHLVDVSHDTNAGMRRFAFRPETPVVGN